jgi:1-acyl-sn-glycerol-3-phosphate acyltransferase
MFQKIFLRLRASAFYVAFMLCSALCTTLLYLALPLPFKVRMELSRTWSKVMLWCGKWICGLDYEIQGFEHIPPQPVIFLVKHQSAWETIVFPGLLPPNCFVYKKSLTKIPIFGWGMALCHHIPVDRNAGVKAFKSVIKLGKQRLSEGLSIVIFPEGTRVAPKQDVKFYKTAASLAKSAEALVVPIAHNSGSCWQRNSFIKNPGKITVVIGPAIETKDLTTEQINDAAYEWIKATMKTLEA